jgi:hypothetical protein
MSLNGIYKSRLNFESTFVPRDKHFKRIQIQHSVRLISSEFDEMFTNSLDNQ